MDSPSQGLVTQAWLDQFLVSRGLKEPDGRPLFAYKTTPSEYQQLADRLNSTSRLSTSTSAFAQAWFLYAAEWWKREYAGGAWAWNPVFRSLSAQAPEYGHIQNMVIKARRQWRLNGDLLGGKKYIGQVAVNGGLPLRLLEAAQGSLARILKAALQHAIAYDLKRPQVYAEIEGQAELLPRSYRQALVFDLLTDIVETVKRLRADHGLAGEKDPLKKLELVHPGWMDQFPLAFDNASAALLINGLVREAAVVGQQQSLRAPFQVVRGLRFSSDGNAMLEMAFEMPTAATKEAIGKALQLDHATLPAAFQLLLRIDGKDYLVGEAHLRGEKVRLLPKNAGIPAHLVKPGVQLVASRYGADITVTSLPGGDALDDDEPWIFEDAEPYARLIRAGSVRIKGESALALVPTNAILLSEPEDPEDLDVAGLDGKLMVRLPLGTTRIVYKKQSYRVQCDTSQASDEGIYWHGSTLNFASVPETIFIDKPVLRYSLSSGGYATAPAAELYQRLTGKDRLSLASPHAEYGVCTISWEKDKDIQSRIKAVLLPMATAVEFEAGKSALEGVVWLRGWPCQSVGSLNDDISVTAQRLGPDWRIHVSATSKASVQSLPLKILWAGGEQKLTLPFPGEGAIILDGSGKVVLRNGWLSIGQLFGCTVRLMPNQRSSSWRIRLSLNGQSANTKQLSQTIFYGQASEIRLFELVDSVKQLISCVTELDVGISLEVINGHTTHAQILIGRYSRQIQSTGALGKIVVSDGQHELGPNETKDLSLWALPIQTPEREPRDLQPHLSEGVFTGTWIGNLTDEQEGTWIIYPSGKNGIDCRPLAISGGTSSAPEIAVTSKLRRALGEPDRDTRITLIGSALEEMAYLPGHSEWQLIEVILQKLGHLPLSGMDLWVALSQQPAAMVMALLHVEGFAEEMAARVPTELPFEWLLTSPQEWIRAFHSLKSYYAENGNDRGFRLLQGDIDSKKAQILHLQPGLKFILQLAYHFGFDSSDKEVTLYQNKADLVIELWLNKQFEGDDSELQSLMRRSMTDQESWPTELKNRTDKFLRTDIGRQVLSHVHFPHDDYKMTTIALPFLVASDVVNENSNRWQKDSSALFALRRYREFDSAWFDSAYLAGLVYAYKGLLPQ